MLACHQGFICFLFCLCHLPLTKQTEQVSWGCKTKNREGTLPEQLFQADQRDIPYYMTLWSEISFQRNKEGRIFMVMTFFFPSNCYLCCESSSGSNYMSVFQWEVANKLLLQFSCPCRFFFFFFFPPIEYHFCLMSLPAFLLFSAQPTKEGTEWKTMWVYGSWPVPTHYTQWRLQLHSRLIIWILFRWHFSLSWMSNMHKKSHCLVYRDCIGLWESYHAVQSDLTFRS